MYKIPPNYFSMSHETKHLDVFIELKHRDKVKLKDYEEKNKANKCTNNS